MWVFCCFSVNAQTESSAFLTQEQISGLGHIDSEFKADSDIWIVHIKDAHCNFQAQLNSYKIFKKLIKEYRFSLICMEGASSPMDLSDITSFPDYNTKKDVTLQFLKKGSINGVEYLRILTPDDCSVIGVENAKTYLKNYNAFFKSLSFRKKSSEITKDLKKILDNEKSSLFSDDLFNFDSEYQKFKREEISVFRFFDSLNLYIDKFRINYTHYPNISALKKALEIKNSFDLTKAENEREQIIKILMNYSSSKEKQSILNIQMKYKFQQISPTQYHKFILNECDNLLVEIDEYPNFTKFVSYSKKLREVNNRKLFLEVDKCVKLIKESLYSNDTEKRLDSLYQSTLVLENAFSLSLSLKGSLELTELNTSSYIKDLTVFLENIDKTGTLSDTVHNIKFLSNALLYVKEYYASAQQRNKYLIENTIEIMRSKNLKKCILYTGGFHTDGICDLMRKKGISYSVITPKTISSSDENSYIKLLTNIKDPFMKILENNLSDFQLTGKSMLSLASRLVPPSNALIDPTGTTAFRIQLKTLYTSEGLKRSLQEIDSKKLLFMGGLNETRLSELSDKIKQILIWSDKNFSNLDGFSLIRKNGNIDLRITIDHQNFYLRNLLSSKKRKRLTGKMLFVDPDELITLKINGDPLSIYSTPSDGKVVDLSYENYTDIELNKIFTAFQNREKISENDLINLIGKKQSVALNIIKTMMESQLLTINLDATYSLNTTKAEVLLAANRLFAYKSDSWSAIKDIRKLSLTDKFKVFLEKHNIVEIDIPSSINFASLVFILDRLPSQTKDFDGEFQLTANIPNNLTSSFVFKKEPLIGNKGFVLTIQPDKKSTTDTIQKERSLLMGENYTDILKKQMFGFFPKKAYSTAIFEKPDNRTIVLNAPTKNGIKTLTWLSPDLPSKFWREIEKTTLFFGDDFSQTGGLIFGKQIGDKYLVSKVVPLAPEDLDYHEDGSFSVKQSRLDELLNKHAIDDIKLLGRYNNRPPKINTADSDITKGDTGYTILMNSNNPKITANPISIIFEPLINKNEQKKESLDSIYIDPKTVETFFYTIDKTPEILTQIPALDFVTPTLDSVRNLYLKTDKQATVYKEETTLAEFQRTPGNNSFVMIPSKNITQEQTDLFIKYFRAIQKEFETFSDASKLVIKGGMENSAHLNREDKVIEINAEMINYPLLTKYLAIPHETNHLNLDFEKDFEEIIVIMLDLYRFAELAIKDRGIALSFLNQLNGYETDEKFFFNITKEIFDTVTKTNQILSPTELFRYTRKYITSAPELSELCSNIIETKPETEFTDIFSNLYKKTLKDVPVFIHGEMDYITFNEQQLTSTKLLGKPGNIIDFTKLNLVYLTQSQYTTKLIKLQKEGRTVSDNPSGFFDLKTGKIYLNKESRFHKDPQDNSVNPDKLLYTITKERSLYFLHKNRTILDNLLKLIESDKETSYNILLYFYELTTGNLIDSLNPKIIEQISNNPFYSTDGHIDYRKVTQQLISRINGYGTFNELLRKYKEIAKNFEKNDKPLPKNIHKRIASLEKTTKDMKPFLEEIKNAKEFIQYKEPDLTPCFSIPSLSIIHIIYEGDKTISSKNRKKDNIILFPNKQVFTQHPIQPKTEQKNITLNTIPMANFNEFLSRVRILQNKQSTTKISYKKALAKQGAQEFYNFLLEKHKQDPLSGLPAQINIVNLYTGTPEFAKDFLDHFRQLDQTNLFYNRLRYNMVSHSKNSKFLLEKLKNSGLLKKYSKIIRFNLSDSLDGLFSIKNPLLVHTYGDINLFSDSIIIEKRGNDFFEIKGKPVIKDTDTTVSPQKLNDYIINPSFSSLEGIPDISKIEWIESAEPIDINRYPFAEFIKRYTEKYIQKRLIFHPSLIEAINRSLNNMEQNNGGYFQFYGNGFNSIEDQIQHPHLKPTSMDGPIITGSKQEYTLETIKERLSDISHANTIPYDLDLERLTEKKLKNLFKDIKISDLRNWDSLLRIRNKQDFRTNNVFIFNMLISELKKRSFLPSSMTISLLKDPDQKDDYIYSIEQALRENFPFVELANFVTHESQKRDILTISDMVVSLKNNSPYAFLSDSFLSDFLTKIAHFSKSTQNFYLRLDSIPIEKPQKPLTIAKKSDNVQIRYLTDKQFKENVNEIIKNRRHLFYGDARGLANPITGEILVNIDHPDHIDSSGKINNVALKQTIIHEKTHMIAFSKQDLLEDIASNLSNKDEEKRQLLKLFYKLCFNETIDFITREHEDLIKANPLWSTDSEINYDRIISEIMSVINQYQILPALTAVVASIQNKLAQKGKTVPKKLQAWQEQLRQVLEKQRSEIIGSIQAIHDLNRIDNRITEHLLYNKKRFRSAIMLSDLSRTSLPLPSASIQTVYPSAELDRLITDTWSKIGNKNILHGKDFTKLKGLRLSALKNALYDIKQIHPTEQKTVDSLNTAVSFWEKALGKGKIHIYPTSPGTYTIKGTHFIHRTKDGDIIIPQDYFDYLRENGLLSKTLISLGSKFLDITDPTENLFDGETIEQIEQKLYDRYLKYHDFVPIVGSILKLYGLTLDDISNKSLEMIISNHENLLKLPGIQTHLEKINKIIESTTSLKYTPASVVEAFSVYADSLSSQDDIRKLQETVSALSDILQRETSPPTIFLIDKNLLTGPLSPQNFAIRENLKRFRNEIEQLEKRNVVIIAVDLKGEPSGKIKEELNNSLLRRGADADDFDYVISYKNGADLFDALRSEYPNLSKENFKSNLKVLALKNSPLVDLAQSHSFNYQMIDDSYLSKQYGKNKGVFLIDYLRSLGLNSFITENNPTDLSQEIRSTLHIDTIDSSINTEGLPQNILLLIDKFSQILSKNPNISDFDQAKKIFIDQDFSIKKEEFSFILPFLESKFYLMKATALLENIQNNSQINLLFEVYSKLLQIYTDTPSLTYSEATIALFNKITQKESKFLKEKKEILSDLDKSGKNKTPLSPKKIKDLFLYTFINDKITENASDFFAIERKVLSDGKLNPVSYNLFIDTLEQNGIPITPSLTSHFKVEVAPRKIHNGLRNLLATQAIFEQSA